MSIAIIIPENWEPAELVRWSTALARAKDEHLLIIRAKRLANPNKRGKTLLDVNKDKSPLMAAIREHAGDFRAIDHNDPRDQKGAKRKAANTDKAQRSIFLKESNHTELVASVQKEIKALQVVLLIVPRRKGVRISEEEFAIERQLFLEVPCEVIQLRPGKKFTDACDSILVATNGKKQTLPALNLGAAFATGEERKVTALYVQQDSGLSPRKNRQRSVERMVRKSLGADAEHVTPDTVFNADVPRGVRSYATVKGHDMVIVGAGGHPGDDRRLPTSVPEKLMAEMGESTIIVVRSAMPLAGRLIKSIEHRKKSLVPQLDRQGRIEVVQRLQSAADWDFDFLALIFLATLLAALGLTLNSSPVVIGAMLVAPLMAPMLGLGLSVVQGNRRMAGKCLGTIGRGFLLAFATGCVVGVVRLIFTSGITEEMSNRGVPSILDLAIAFVSGMVAAYAFGRPHLLSVLPGIAIASSLVPPVATSGLALIALDLDVALGSTMLFLSNFVAIVLGSAFSLWVVGMRGPREVCPFTAWAQRWTFGLVAVAVCLAVFSTVKSHGSPLRVSSVVLDGESPERPSPEPAQVDSRITVNEQTATDAASSESNGPKTQRRDAAEEGKIRVVLKPAVEEGGQTQGPSVTVVLPAESKAGGANTSVQIEGLPSEDVLEILDGVLSDKEKP